MVHITRKARGMRGMEAKDAVDIKVVNLFAMNNLQSRVEPI
jgi:hypothetical protein